jgi:TonB family protein
MNQICSGSFTHGMRRMGTRIFQIAAVALLVAVSLPAHAGDDRAIKSRVAPVYPEIAKRMKIAGVVRIEATVDPEGKVTGVKTVAGNHMLSVVAEDAVKQWKFASAPAESKVDVEVNFAGSQ